MDTYHKPQWQDIYCFLSERDRNGLSEAKKKLNHYGLIYITSQVPSGYSLKSFVVWVGRSESYQVHTQTGDDFPSQYFFYIWFLYIIRQYSFL